MNPIRKSTARGRPPGGLWLAMVATVLLGTPAWTGETTADLAQEAGGHPPGAPLASLQSVDYSIERLSLAATGGEAASVDYTTSITLGQESPSGASSVCNTSYVNGFGFWSVLGGPYVPAGLELATNPVDPLDVDLRWCGSDPVFEVFRSASPDDVTELIHRVHVTAACAYTDGSATASDLYFYNVLPQSPGQ